MSSGARDNSITIKKQPADHINYFSALTYSVDKLLMPSIILLDRSGFIPTALLITSTKTAMIDSMIMQKV
jgi:hypothetical protein